MAWQVRITEIRGDAPGPPGPPGGPPGPPAPIDLTLQGRFAATAEYFDAADPATILHRQNFDFDFGISGPEALERIKEVGRRIRDTRELIAAQQPNVGRTFPL